MEDLIEEQDFSTPKRPAFITVLAILSWIYIGLGLVGVLSTATKSNDELDNEIANAVAQLEISPLASTPFFEDYVNFVEGSAENAKTTNMFNLILLLIEGLGVFMMFQLKKTGYWIYTASSLLFIGLPILFLPWPNSMSSMTLGIYIFIVILFQILYGVNLKHMKK